jgi:FtsZ-interacting cell division protein ZipA
MGELRFILLVAGLIFLVVLAVWELRKPRQAAAGDAALRRSSRSEPELGIFSDSAGEHAMPAMPATRLRSASAPPPRIDLAEMEAIRAESMLANSDALPVFDSETLDRAQAPDARTTLDDLVDTSPAREPAATEPATGAAATMAAAAAAGVPADAGPPAAAVAAAVNGTAAPLVVDWPDEAHRYIIALRLVPATNQRLSGRSVRLAITACGFVPGPYGIYHQPDSDGRALVSVASLSKPGVLDPVNMDFLRLAGLNLFTVLPGVLPPPAALDHLLETARELSQRLAARVQNEHGQPLDSERLEDLRDRMQSLSSGFQAEPAA